MRDVTTPQYEQVHEMLDAEGWLVGRVTGQDFARREAYPTQAAQSFPREAWIATKKADGSYAIVLDAHGKIAWGRSDIGGDAIVVVLTEQVSDAVIEGLRADGVSYIFAGKSELDLRLALETLSRELGVKKLLLEGGGITNGAFLRAGLIDELSLLIYPYVDGAPGVSSVFDALHTGDGQRAPLDEMTLSSSQTLDGGVVWLRYQIQNQPRTSP